MITFLPIIQQTAPRILTQVCRDPSSPNYGCFDRNWWHYKMRDFPSVILQQGGYYLYLLKELPGFEEYEKELHEISKASILFWVQRGLKKGAFEEYYPWERGYPPLAFSTLAMAKLIKATGIEDDKISKSIKKAANQLLSRFENRAANQQVAGLAALAVIRNIYPQIVNEEKFKSVTQKTLGLQNDEGWFMEYDGPDLGYLTVTLDCLWDLYDNTGDEIFLEAAGKALGFLAELILHMNGSIGMHNARNTDYIVPYGITRFLKDGSNDEKTLSMKVLDILYKEINDPGHFFYAVDDRYWIHYIGHSVLRAELILQKINFDEWKQNVNIQEKTDEIANFSNAGYILKSELHYKTLLNCYKGGVFTIYKEKKYFSDYGWILNIKNTNFVTHWWNPEITIHNEGESFTIGGYMIPHREMNSTPLKHIALRIASYFLGQKIITLLKDRLIFKKLKSDYSFERKVSFFKDRILVSDIINGLEDNEEIIPAPRASKRHVASADSFHYEDFRLKDGFKYNRTVNKKEKIFTSELTINTI